MTSPRVFTLSLAIAALAACSGDSSAETASTSSHAGSTHTASSGSTASSSTAASGSGSTAASSGESVTSTGSSGDSSGDPTSGSTGSETSGGVDYAAAVRAAKWIKLPEAPSVKGGPKQDDAYFLDAELGVVASGPEWSLFATSDGGATWGTLLEQKGTFFRSVYFRDSTHGFAGNLGVGLVPQITDANVMYETKDGGKSWDPVTNITGPAPEGICNFAAFDDAHLFAVGRANGPAHLMSSSDSGASWTSVDLGEWLMMAIDVHFSSPTEGLVAGMGLEQKCTIIRTTDGGTTFEPVFTSATPGSLCWKLDFPSAAVGYLAVQDTTTGPGTFGKTTDGGATWEELPLPTTETYGALAAGFITEEIGWMVPNQPNLPAYVTFDGGSSWEEEPDLVGPINRFRFPDAKTGYAVGGDVYKLEIDIP